VDTIATIAGQVAVAHMGAEAHPAALLGRLAERDLVERVGGRFSECNAVA
jgi:hypothetical protein